MIVVDTIAKEKWASLSEHAHKIAFGTYKPASWDRIDGAFLPVEDGVVLGYITFRELDPDTAYWQFGGAMPSSKDTTKSFRAYQACVGEAKKRWKRITTYIENDNTVMLKFAMRVGFKIVGVRTFKGSILLEHLLEFDHE